MEGPASAGLKDDPQDGPHVPKNPNFRRGYISFAGGGRNSRSTDVFITFLTGNQNGQPGAPWEVPFGEVTEGIEHVMAFTDKYGDLPVFGGHCPDYGRLWEEGYDFLAAEYPEIDYLGTCTLGEDEEPSLEV